MKLSSVAVVALFTLATGQPVAGAEYRFSKIAVPGAVQTEAFCINARGSIVGAYTDADEVRHGFLLRDGVFTTIEVPGALETNGARGINARGDIVGNYSDDEALAHGFLFQDGQFTEITIPGAGEVILERINNAGDIVGGAFGDVSGGFLLRDGVVELVRIPRGDISLVRGLQDNGRVLVGHVVSRVDGQSRGFVRRAPGEFELIEIPGLQVQCLGVRSINQRGDMVGAYSVLRPGEECHVPFAEQHGFVIRDGQRTQIDFPGAPATDAFSINDDGVIVGRYTDWNGRTRGFKAVPVE